ncbi:MAG TPA: GxxExxY protein [Spartobacteria bacterium]|jgi:GxxExxY protein|nr:GxxExxY protein [Spartobacteria bacterium]
MNQESRKTGRLRNRQLTDRIISSAIHVHRELGPGFLESIYEEALAVEFALSGVQFIRQKPIPLFYKDHQVGEHRLDFLVEGKIVVELKAISALEDIHFAIGRSYLKATNLEDGLLLNFATSPLTIKRFCRELPTQSEDVDLAL